MAAIEAGVGGIRIGVLDRDLDVDKAHRFQQGDLVQRAFHHRLRGDPAVLVEQTLLQRAAVDPMRMGMPTALAASPITPTLEWSPLRWMLPGLMSDIVETLVHFATEMADELRAERGDGDARTG